MASNSSFDIVSDVDMQEVDNAVNQTTKELSQRYDFKGVTAEVKFNRQDKKITINSESEFHINQIYQILMQKMSKRQISVKALAPGDIQTTLGTQAKQEIEIRQGISKEDAKRITKDIKAQKFKVQTQIQDEQVRVTAPKKDTLQEVIQFIRSQDYEFPVQFTNYR